MQEEDLQQDLDFTDHRPDHLGMGNFEDEGQMQSIALATLNDDDMEVVRSSFTILLEMKDAAETIEDLQGELSVEIIQSCILTRKRMAKIVEAKSVYGQIQSGTEQETIEQITVYLEMIDFIDNCMQAYKDRYTHLKQKKLKKIEKQKEEIQK